MSAFTNADRDLALQIAHQVDLDRYIRSLEALVRIPSHDGREGEIADWLAKRLRAIGMRDAAVDPCFNVVGRLGDGPRRLLLIAHRNIQSPGVGMRDPNHPEVAVVEGERVMYGLGIASSKASTASMLEALAVVGPELDPSLTLIFASHPGSFGPAPCDIGDLFQRHNLSAEGAIVSEPTQLKLGIGARGYAHLEVTVEGSPHHAGRPDNHQNPIVALATLMGDVFAQPLPSHPSLGPATLTPIDWWANGDRPQTPGRASALFDRRLLPSEPSAEKQAAAIKSYLEKRSDGLRVEVNVRRRQFPYEVTREAPVVAALAEGVRLATGDEAQFLTLPYSCGAGTVQKVGGIDPVAFSGNDVGYLGDDEHVVLDSNLIATRALVCAIALFATR